MLLCLCVQTPCWLALVYISCLPFLCTGIHPSFKVWLPNDHWHIGAISQTSLKALLDNGIRYIVATPPFLLDALLRPSLRHRWANSFLLYNSVIFSFPPLMLNILNKTTFFNFLPLPPSITIGLCIPLLPVFLFTCIFSSGFVGTHRHFSSWLAAHDFILTHVFPHYFLGGLIVPYSLTPPPATLLLDARAFP